MRQSSSATRTPAATSTKIVDQVQAEVYAPPRRTRNSANVSMNQRVSDVSTRSKKSKTACSTAPTGLLPDLDNLAQGLHEAGPSIAVHVSSVTFTPFRSMKHGITLPIFTRNEPQEIAMRMLSAESRVVQFK